MGGRTIIATLLIGLITLISPISSSDLRDGHVDQHKDVPEFIVKSIPDDAVLVSQDLAVTKDGSLKSVSNGHSVTDKQLIGTSAKPADPLAKTYGHSFIPVKVGDARRQESSLGEGSLEKSGRTARYVEQNGKSSKSAALLPSAQAGSVVSSSLAGNSYGAYWGTYSGSPAFFEADGSLFAQKAKGVIDVSQWQGSINWDQVRQSGIEGAIIRIGWGWGNGFDSKALRNIAECKRLGIPFGIYLYSYAYDGGTGRAEGNSIVDLLRRAGISPNDLTYPIYYDLEQWVWKDHVPPSSPSTYKDIVNSWFTCLQNAGFQNLSVYSYASYLNSALNSPDIVSRTSWVASYGRRPGFNFYTNYRCWQYADNGRISGIGVNTDLNACGVKDSESGGDDPSQLEALTDMVEGDYYIESSLDDKYLDISGGTQAEAFPVQVWAPTDGSNQLFHIKPEGSGTYSIVAKHSGKALDVRYGSARNGNEIIQYTQNGGVNQRWRFYRAPDGFVYVTSALNGGKSAALDIPGGNTSSGTQLEIWQFNGGMNQSFRLLQTAKTFSGTNSFTNRFANGNSFDVEGASRASDAHLQTWTPNGGDNQKFILVYKRNGQFALQAVHSGMYLDIQYGYQGDEGNIVQFPSTGGDNQLWYLQHFSGGYAIRSVLNNKAIDICGANVNPGARLISYTFHRQNNQLWDMRQ